MENKKRLLEKQKSFHLMMERQFSFGGNDRKKSKESPGKRGDTPLHLFARAGNLSKIKEGVRNCDVGEARNLLCKLNQEGETPLYVAAAEYGHALVVACGAVLEVFGFTYCVYRGDK